VTAASRSAVGTSPLAADPPAAASVAIALPKPIREAIVAHCRRELPNEACGLVAGTAPAGRGGHATRWLPARNVHASPYRYEVHPDDLVRLTLDIDDAGEVIWAIVHSHVASPARPSATDRRAWRDPDVVQLVVSMGSGPEPEVRAWRIAAGALDEVPLAEAPLAG
jgi:proteasome lid subunit RPN8/RPN11